MSDQANRRARPRPRTVTPRSSANTLDRPRLHIVTDPDVSLTAMADYAHWQTITATDWPRGAANDRWAN